MFNVYFMTDSTLCTYVHSVQLYCIVLFELYSTLYDCTLVLYDCTLVLYDCTLVLYDCTLVLYDCMMYSLTS